MAGSCNNPDTLPRQAPGTLRRVARRSPRRERACLSADAPHRPYNYARSPKLAKELAGVEVGALQHVVHSLSVHPEGSPDPDRRQLTVVN
jgi:hypothetical protein